MSTENVVVARMAGALSPREARWVLRRCGRRGHVVAVLSDPGARGLVGPSDGDPPDLLRCLRCGCWVQSRDPGIAEQVGTREQPADWADLPLPVRGAHGRRFGLLRVLAVERAGRGLLMVLGAVLAYEVAAQRGTILAEVQRLLVALRPLGVELGFDLTGSWIVVRTQEILGGSGDSVRLVGLGLLGYGLLQMVEGFGLWGGWRWAEYLAAIATSAFIPLEIYELANKPTVLKAGALVLNIAVVVYLVVKGRLFGVRGGHTAYLAEVRDSTLPADLLRDMGRPTTELAGHRVV